MVTYAVVDSRVTGEADEAQTAEVFNSGWPLQQESAAEKVSIPIFIQPITPNACLTIHTHRQKSMFMCRVRYHTSLPEPRFFLKMLAYPHAKDRQTGWVLKPELIINSWVYHSQLCLLQILCLLTRAWQEPRNNTRKTSWHPHKFDRRGSVPSSSQWRTSLPRRPKIG